MNIQTVRDNLRNTIAGKEKMLAQYREDIEILNNDRKLIAYEGEIGSLHITARFLDINIGELQRILADVEACMEWDQYALSTFEKLEEFKNKRNYPIPPEE